jgi:crotonobetainyl-CoA:carnitine CoA-transferase CaiB-like acyl-CoA transferase
MRISVKTAGDGQLFIGVTSDQQWTRFVEEFGLQELAADPRLATNVMRLAECAWLIPALQEVLATLPQDEVARRCERCNVSWAPVGQPGDLFTDPHLLATGGLVDVLISRFGGGDGKVTGLPALPVEFGTDRNVPAYGVSHHAWASTTPRCWAKPASPPLRSPISRKPA